MAKRFKWFKNPFSRKNKQSPKIPWWAWRRRMRQKKEVEAGEGAPRITNDTVAEHREEVLSGARRFVYPLQHSRHRVVIISALIIIFVVVVSLGTSGLLLYRYQSNSDFAYQISKIIPFPISKVNGDYVAYEDYLFEVKNSLFYYRNHGQEDVDVDSEAGEALVLQVKQQSLEKVKMDAIAKQIAKEHGITVSEQEINNQIERIRTQGGVGDSEQVLEDILQDFYNWDVNDLRYTIRLQLLRQKLPGVLDTEAVERAQRAKQELDEGADFAEVAEKHSDDVLTRDSGGVIGLISRTNTDLPSEFIEATFNLKEGETSEVIESGFGLHIIQNRRVDGDQVEVAHILIQYMDINEYLRQRLEEATVKDYIEF